MMLITLNLADENSLYSGLDFALTCLAFEQVVELVILDSANPHDISKLSCKFQTLYETGLTTIYHLNSENITRVSTKLKYQTLSSTGYTKMANQHDTIVSF